MWPACLERIKERNRVAKQTITRKQSDCMDQNPKVISFENVTKAYSLGDRQLAVLKDMTFSIKKGEFVSVMGPSGSGKSTLLQLMGCLDQPSSGKVFIDGVDVSTFNSEQLAEIRSNKIGFVFQAFNLLPNLTALQNVEIAMSINEVPKQERMEKAKRLLKLVDLSERETHVPSELSGGEKQRVAVARALANNPSFLLADEPTGNLDSKSGTDVMNLIRDLWKTKQTTIVMVTHEPVVAQYSQRAIHIRDGMIESEEKMRGAGFASSAGKKIDLKLK